MNIQEAKNVYFAYCNHIDDEIPSRHDLWKALGAAIAEVKALYSPHPEAREEDIKAIRDALELGKDYATQVLQGHDMMYKRHPATKGERKDIVDDVVTINHGLSALSRLAAPKPEVNDKPNNEEVKRFIDKSIEIFSQPEHDNGYFHGFCDALVSVKKKIEWIVAGSNGELSDTRKPAAPEPRPAEEPCDVDETNCVDIPGPAPAPSEEYGPLKSVIHALETADDLGSSVVLDPEEISALRSQLAQATNNAQFWMGENSKTTRYYEAQLARKDEGLRMALEEAAQSLEALAGLAGKDETMLEYDQVRGYALNRAMAARAALREPYGRKGE